MPLVSLCMIVKNEELVLEKCLASIVGIADEIIIVDTGSTDNTIKIALKYVNKVHHFDWIDDFSAARNYADSLATGDYILRWDADWMLQEGDMTKLERLKKTHFHSVDLINFSWVDRYEIHGIVTYQPLLQETLFFLYKKNTFHWSSPIHNELVANNPEFVAKSYTDNDIKVFHLRQEAKKLWRKQQTLDILQKHVTTHGKPNLRMQFFYARELYFAGEYEKSYHEYNKLISVISDIDQRSYIYEKMMFCLFTMNNFDELSGLVTKLETVKHPRIPLILADIACISDVQKAQHLYKSYLTNALKQTQTCYEYDRERYIVHPHLQLGKLHIHTSELGEAKKHLTLASEFTHLHETEKKCILLLEFTN